MAELHEATGDVGRLRNHMVRHFMRIVFTDVSAALMFGFLVAYMTIVGALVWKAVKQAYDTFED
jgi:amino acid permease